MSLPELIEIVPLPDAVEARVTVPGSKSITNRALTLAALGRGQTTLHGALWSEDTQVMVQALRELGFAVTESPDPDEVCNRTITVQGLGGTIPRAGTPERPVEIFVGNAGTAARFLAALVCLGQGVYRLHGVPRMHERPQAALFSALRDLGYRVDSPNHKLPAVIHGTGPREGRCRIRLEESSQFASALLLSGGVGRWSVEVVGENAEESAYVTMTSKLIHALEGAGGVFQVEPDASSGSYFLAADRLARRAGRRASGGERGPRRIHVAHWPGSGWQIDERFPSVLAGCRPLDLGLDAAGESPAGRRCEAEPPPEGVISRGHDLGDSIMMAIALAPFSAAPVRFTELGRLRIQECERVAALRTELTRCGGKVIEAGDTLTVYPSPLHGAQIETYQDHRMAMCFAILGLRVPGMTLQNPACVKKTFPDFFQKLAEPPPHGLGALVRDPRTGRSLSGDELFAE